MIPFLYLCSLFLPLSEDFVEGNDQNAPAAIKAKELEQRFASSPDEPLAKQLSLKNSADHLDSAATAWLTRWKCAACHTSYIYVMAGPSLRSKPSPAFLKMRQHLEYRVSHWDSGKDADQPGQGSAIKPLPTEGVTEIVATAATLAFHDGQSGGKLDPLTRQALDRMWTLQRPNGAWTWNRSNLAPLEYDDYFGAVFAAVGVGAAPEGYAQTPQAQQGLAKLRTYFQNTPPPYVHHKAWLLWAATKLDGLLTPEQRRQAMDELLALQQGDGGWSLPTLWKDAGGTETKPASSDGYATGLALYVLRQSGVSADDPRMKRGINWLKTRQRESGRWFTQSLNGSKRRNLITNAGTALCAMALKACGEVEE